MTSDVLLTVLGIALVAAAAAFVLLPFVRGPQAEVAASEPGPTDRFVLYRQVLELEFDHQLGKLSTEDYEQLSGELLAEAGQALREERGSIGELDDEIEREIAAARAAFAAARSTSRKPAGGVVNGVRFAALAALALLLVSVLPAAAEPNDGSVSGQLVNKTANGGTTGGSTVILVSFGRKEQAPLGQQTTQADADGRYSFANLDRDPNIVYLALARYQNVNYPTDQPFQLVDQAAYQADISVYEATTTDDAIQIDRLNLLVMGADQGMAQLMEMGTLVNSGDRTFVTANPQDQQLARAIKFALPPGALSVQMQSGFNEQDVTAGVGGVQVTSPVLPGRHDFAMSFQLPYSGSTADLTMQIPYPTGTYSVYLPDTGIKLDSTPLAAGGSSQLGGQSYALYSASNLSKSTMVGGQLSGLGSNGAVGPNQLALISLGIVLFVVGGGVLLFAGRVRPGMLLAQHADQDFDQERLELVVRLAALDERFAAGELSQTEYDAERDRGKQRLLELALARRHTAPAAV